MKKLTDKLVIRFLGGAGTVTGSKILVELEGKRILIDCGLFQGLKALRLANRAPFPIDPSTIDALLLTHAHLDHSGYIPRLVKNGFRGVIYCTTPTRDLTDMILLDSAKIQEEEAERANRYGYTRHRPAKPLYTTKDVLKAMTFFTTQSYHEWVVVNEFMKFQFRNSGHILGSALLEVKIMDKTFVFSGDLGRRMPLILHPPEFVKSADVIIMESTYGDRQHDEADAKEQLHQIIWDTFSNNGILMIPTFAVERAQELLYLLSQLKEEKRLPDIPIYLDSPMGVHATNIVLKHRQWHALSLEECLSMDTIADLITNADASRAVVADDKPKIVLAGSGMITGGRILHYLEKFGGDPKNTILLAGFQAVGTRGRALIEGATEIKFFGKYHRIKAKINQIHTLSAHADQSEIIQWLSHIKNTPEQVILNHGEPHQSDALRVKIKDELGWNCKVAQSDVSYLFSPHYSIGNPQSFI